VTEEERANVQYKIVDNVREISDELAKSFSVLAPDRFLRNEDCFRYRAFGQAEVAGMAVHWTDGATFRQDRKFNSYAGGTSRTFEPVRHEAKAFTEQLVTDREVRKLISGDNHRIGVHQIRVIAKDGMTGYPAPEGFHRDGFDYVAITSIAHVNVNGGVSLVAADEHCDEIIFDGVLTSGQMLILDDRRVTHYVTPITPKFPGRAAYRDVMVVTFHANDSRPNPMLSSPQQSSTHE